MSSKKSKLLTYFNNKFDVSSPSPSGWYRFESPFYESKGSVSCGVQIQNKWVHDFRTGDSMSVWDFIMRVEKCSFKQAKEIIKKQRYGIELVVVKESLNKIAEVTLPEEAIPLEFCDRLLAKRAKKFLAAKKMSHKGLYYCSEGKYFGRILIPLTVFGELVYFIGRDFIGQTPKYYNLDKSAANLFYNEDALFMQDKIYLGEGWSDAETMGKKGVGSLGWSMNTIKILKLLRSPVQEIIIMSDKGFYTQALETASWLCDKKRVKVLNIDPYCEGDKKDPNDLGKKLIKKIEKKSKFLTKAKVMREIPLPF